MMENQRAEAFLAESAEELLQLYPENASLLGLDHGERAALKSRLTDRSAEGIAEAKGRITDRLTAIRSFDRRGANAEARLHLDIGEAAFDLVREGMEFGFGDASGLNMGLSHRSTPYVVSQNTGAYVELPDFLEAQHGVASAADADAFLARLQALAGAIDGETGRIRSDGAAGVVLPDFLLHKTIAQIAAQRDAAVASWPWLQSFPGQTARFGGHYALQAHAVAADCIAPALDRQVEALTALLPAATGDAGVWKLPQGEAFYGWALRANTTTDLEAREVHRLGLEHLALLQGRMEPLLRAQGLTRGTIGERMAALGNEPRHRFPNDAEGRKALIAYIEDCLSGMRARMPDAFATLVPCRMAVRRVPEAIEQGAPDGYAMAGSVDGLVPGYFYINLRDTTLWPRHALPTLAFHEAIPGHIWQGEYTYRLPLFRSLLSFNAYAEGWALYAEQLADELGAYDDDPLGRLGYLQSLAFRACRLAVDTGIHAMRWSREQAVAWFVENNGSSHVQVAGEVDRYLVWPGQACSYKVGHARFQAIREEAMVSAGAGFDLRSFNDKLVRSGSMPLNLLETVFA